MKLQWFILISTSKKCVETNPTFPPAPTKLFFWISIHYNVWSMTFEKHWFRPLTFPISWSTDIRKVSSLTAYSPALALSLECCKEATVYPQPQSVVNSCSASPLLFEVPLTAQSPPLFVFYFHPDSWLVLVLPLPILTHPKDDALLLNTDRSLLCWSLRKCLILNTICCVLSFPVSTMFLLQIERKTKEILIHPNVHSQQTVCFNTVEQPGQDIALHGN